MLLFSDNYTCVPNYGHVSVSVCVCVCFVLLRVLAFLSSHSLCRAASLGALKDGDAKNEGNKITTPTKRANQFFPRKSRSFLLLDKSEALGLGKDNHGLKNASAVRGVI